MERQLLTLQFSLQNASKAPYYTERKKIKTNAQGVISHVIGTGTPIASSGVFVDVPWSNGDIYIQVEIDPAGSSNFVSMGDPAKLQSVPYALFAKNNKEVISQSNATDDDPIFVVRNKEGKIVFAVYQTGVRVYVDDTGTKGVRGGFAVGGLTNQKLTGPEYFRITPDSARVNVNEGSSGIKGMRGGFAVGGLTGQKGISRDLLFIAPDSARIRLKDTGKGTKGGFAVGSLSAKESSGNYLDLTPQNSFIGQDAGKSNTTGERNAFIGYQAGFTNSTGNDNVFIGNASGLGNLNGKSNIFLGTSSGKNNTSGSNNIFLGTSSGEQNTTGVSNISIGTLAGQSLKTGLKNIFIGVEAGLSNAVGSDNVFIGNFAGNQNIASSNVFIGRTAGMQNTTGTNNVFVGEQSGRYNIEGSGNLFLGDQAGFNEKGSNKLYVSNSSTNTPLIYGEFDKAKVEINGSVKVKDLLNLMPRTTIPNDPTEGDVIYDASLLVVR